MKQQNNKWKQAIQKYLVLVLFLMVSEMGQAQHTLPSTSIIIGPGTTPDVTPDVDNVELVYDLNSITLTASVKRSSTYSELSGAVTIPSSVEYESTTYTVTSIGENAFEWCTGLTSINIPESVTSIGNKAFYYCKNLTSINIPNSVTSIGNAAFYDCKGLTSINIPESVTSIGNDAFGSCEKLTSVNIPNSVTSIGGGAFEGCTELTNVNIPKSITVINNFTFCQCKKLTSINIPESVTSIGHAAFASCTGLTSVNIPESITSIGSDAFSNCTELTSINIPNAVTSIEDETFNNCRKLTSITIPESVTTIGNEAFKSCWELTSINIPNSVTSIGREAFSGCSELKNITIPESVTSIGEYAFCNCTLSPLIILGENKSYSSSIAQLNESSVIYAYSTEFDKIRNSWWNGRLVDITPFLIPKGTPYVTGYTFTLCENERTPIKTTLSRVTINDTLLQADENGLYKVMNLRPDSTYTLYVYYNREGKEYYCTTKITTKKSVVTAKITTTQTTATLNTPISATEDTYSKVIETGIIFNGVTYTKSADDLTLTGLVPNKEYSYTPYAVYPNGISIRGASSTFTTQSLSPVLTLGEVTPTTLYVTGSYTQSDAHVKETGFKNNTTGNALEMSGLKPNTNYIVTYYVDTEEGSHEEISKLFTTIDIRFNTLKAKSTSNTCAVICAETNIADAEVNTGFEWRRVDAPDIVPSEDAPCVVYEGAMEGILRNLSANTYYKYRPYYEAADGTRYYGEWIGFGTADAYVYFTPTVRTYATATVESNTVRLKGYVLQGSDEITEQGFEYWTSGTGARSVTDVKTVAATGQRMSATLEGLEYNTTYTYRAYVKTAKETTYGEEMTFTTPLPNGITETVADEDGVLKAEVRCQGGVQVRLTGVTGEAAFRLYSTTGTLLAAGRLTADGTWQPIDTGRPIEQGIYLLHVSHGKQQKTVKFMPAH